MYCTDTLLDVNDPETQGMTNQSLELLFKEISEGRQPTGRPGSTQSRGHKQSMKPGTQKNSPVKALLSRLDIEGE